MPLHAANGPQCYLQNYQQIIGRRRERTQGFILFPLLYSVTPWFSNCCVTSHVNLPLTEDVNVHVDYSWSDMGTDLTDPNLGSDRIIDPARSWILAWVSSTKTFERTPVVIRKAKCQRDLCHIGPHSRTRPAGLSTSGGLQRDHCQWTQTVPGGNQ